MASDVTADPQSGPELAVQLSPEQANPEPPDPGWLPAVLQAQADVLDEYRPAAVAGQHARGKLTARERIAALVDPDSLLEYGALATADEGYEHLAGVESPADGVVTAIGAVNGRPTAIIASDFTVMGGSIGHAGLAKMVRMTELALDQGLPLVMLLDGGGHRIQEGLDSRSFAFGGPGTFPAQVLMSGWVPQVTAMLGPGFAGPANFSSLADFVPIVRGIGSIGIAGPPLVKFATGESLSTQELGGAQLHEKTGIVDAGYDTELECLQAIKRFLSFLPQNAAAPAAAIPATDPPGRLTPELRSVVPANRRRAYDMRLIIGPIVDNGDFMELKARHAPNVITCLARLAGRPVGIVASQPRSLAGVLDSPACDKAARFISMCDAFGLPVISLIDMPGFLVGSKAEQTGLVRHGGKLLMAFGNATVPVVSLVIRKGYGLGYLAMAGGRSFGAVGAYAWPSAELCAMQIEGAVDVAFRREYNAAPDPAARRAELIESFYDRVNPIRAASGFGIDDVIDPAQTRRVLCSVLAMAAPRRQSRVPARRHHIEPI